MSRKGTQERYPEFNACWLSSAEKTRDQGSRVLGQCRNEASYFPEAVANIPLNVALGRSATVAFAGSGR